jgi:hypothetical protein
MSAPHPGRTSIAGVRPPDTAVARAAEGLCREASDWALYAHTARSYYFAMLLARGERVGVDEEALYVGCILHDIGLTPAYDDPVRPFEHISAAAANLVSTFRWPRVRRDNLERAVILHMADEVDDGESPEARMLEAGVACDVTGHRLDELDPRAREDILRQLPRGPFKREFTALMRREAERKPDCAAALLARRGLLERIEQAPFDDS